MSAQNALVLVIFKRIAELLGRGAKRSVNSKASDAKQDGTYGNDKNCCRLHRFFLMNDSLNPIILQIIKVNLLKVTYGTKDLVGKSFAAPQL